MSEETPTYYDLPAIKEPVWTWEVPAYFYVGGAAGGAATIGALLQSLGDDDSDRVVRRCRAIAAAGTALGTVLLVRDLGRPERFLNMLRVFKPSSPLNVGSWTLAAATGLSAGAALLPRGGDSLVRVGDAAGLGAGLVGLPLAGYTAVLVADTAVPVWQESRRSLPALFLASSTGAACSLVELGNFSERELTAVRRLGTITQIVELVAAKAVERETGRVERVGRPYREGLSGTLWKASTALTIASFAVDQLTGRRRAGRVAAALLGSASSVALRFSVWQAGKQSARDPRATFELQRNPTT